METKIYKLKTAVKWGNDEIKELTFRKPKGKDLFDLKGEPGVGDIAKIASKLSGVELPVFKEMEVEDFMEVMEIVGNLINPSQATGDKVSP